MKIAILESLGITDEELMEFETPFVEEGHTFVSYEKTTDVKTLQDEVEDTEAVILANMPFPAEAFQDAEGLKFIDIAFTGVDHVAVAAAKEKGILLSNASGYSNEAVAELAIGMMLSILRNVRQVEDRCREGKTKDGLVGSELKGKTVGIIGLGKIGSRTAELLHAFGAKILAQSKSVHADAPAYVRQVSQEELLKESDIVVLHCPLNDSTRGMIDGEKLSMMKKTAILINVARGPVVVEEDLARALRDGTIAGAGIDVFDIEPPLPVDNALLSAPGTLVTPHVAFATKESMRLRAEIVFDNLRAYLDGGQKNAV